MTSVADVAAQVSDQTRGQRGPVGPPRAGQVDLLGNEIVERWKRSSEELLRQRRDYWQNLSFFFGEQWVWWDRRNRLQSFPIEWSPLGKGRARLVINRFAPNIVSVLGRMLRNELEFDVLPTDSADDVVAAAMLASDVANSVYRDRSWREVRYNENFAKLMGGTAAVAVEWDPTAGSPLAVDEQTHAVVGTGDVNLTALAVTEFGLQPGVRDWRHATWWVQGLALDPDYVRDHYRLSWTPAPDVSSMLSPLQQRLLEHLGKGQGGNRLCLVLTCYERPNRKRRNGLYAVVVNGVTIARSDWPFVDRDRLNVFLFRQEQVDNTWIGRTYASDAVPVQMAYNFARSSIAEHTKKVGNARIIAPAGSFEESDMTDEPGSILWYLPDVGGGKPEFMAPAQVPGWLVNDIATLKAELDDIMFVHDTSRGHTTIDRASGQALALLAEKDDSPLGLMATEEAHVWGELMSYVLRLYEKKVVETRRIEVMPRVGQVGETRMSRWNGAALRGQTRVRVPLEATMPMSLAAMQAFAKDLWDRQIIKDPQKYARLARLPHRELVDVMDADAAKAMRENVRMMEGVAMYPAPFDDHGVHIAEHNRFRKSDSYQYASRETRLIVDLHVLYHEKLEAEQTGRQVMRASLHPALAAMPQADEPPGSAVPTDWAEQQTQQVPVGAAAGNLPHGGPETGPDMPPDLPGMIGGSVGVAAGTVGEA